MIRYNENDLIKLDGYNDILGHLGESPVEDEEVWSIARQYEEEPIFENILLELTLDKIENALSKKFGLEDVNHYVNSMDTHLYVESDEIWDWEDLENFLKENNIKEGTNA